MPSITSDVEQLEQDGYLVKPSILDDTFLDTLRGDLDVAFEYCSSIKREKFGNNFQKGGLHHILELGDSFLTLLEKQPFFPIIEGYLDGKFILNNFGAFVNSGDASYVHGMTVHRDVRTCTEDYAKQMLIMLVTLDDFTKENGATMLLPRSHKTLNKPTEEEFNANSIRAIVPSGSIILMDARVWHSAGSNVTNGPRRSLTIGFTRPFFKPQYDYCRAFGNDAISSMPDHLKQVLGFYSRVPENHEQWYQSEGKYYYRGDQG